MRNGIDAVSAPLPTLFVSPPAVFTASLERLPHALGRPRRPAPAGVTRHSRQRPVADWRHHAPLTSQRRRPCRRKRFIPAIRPSRSSPSGPTAAPARSFEPAWSPSHERKQIHLSTFAAAGLARHPRPRPTGATTWSPGSTSCTTTPARIAADRRSRHSSVPACCSAPPGLRPTTCSTASVRRARKRRRLRLLPAQGRQVPQARLWPEEWLHLRHHLR